MNDNRLEEKLNKYRGKIIHDNYLSSLSQNSTNAYNAEKAVNKGYNIFSSHKDISKDSIKVSLNAHNTDLIFQKVNNKFSEVYNFNASDLNFIGNRTMGSINAFIKGKYVFFDRMLEDTVHAFFMVTLIWAKYFDDENLYGRFFNYLTTVLYAAIIDKGTYNIYELEYIKSEVLQWSSTVNLAVSCQYFCMYFCIAHEIAHKYIAEQGKKIKAMQEEFKADTIAYDIVLRLLMDEENSDMEIKNRELFDYCYLAPMMIFDFWDVLFYTNRVITKSLIIDDEHPEIKKRKESLFSIPYKKEYNFNTTEGNDVYSAFLDVIDKYKTELLYRQQTGTIDEFIAYIKGDQL